MLKKSLSIYFFVFLLAAIISGCCDCNTQTFRFKWKNMELNSLSYVLDSDRIVTLPDTSTDFSGKRYALLVTLNGERIASDLPLPGLMNQAYACKCPENDFLPNYFINEIQVYSVNAFDTVHPAGARVTEYFKSSRTSDQGRIELVPVNPVSFDGRYYGWGTSLSLFLDNKPTLGHKHQFEVTVTFTDGSSFTELTPELTF